MSSRKRELESQIRKYATQYPIITLSGPRQSGKTTLAQMLFPDKPYVSLENLDERQFAIQDPQGFLNRFEATGAIIDEVQRAPDIVSYLQTLSDRLKKDGHFILTGSQQCQMRSSISQSLAGRTALATLLPFSINEAYPDLGHADLNTVLYTGFYPRIFDKSLNPTDMLAFYTNTYLERDVRQLLMVRDLSKFERFIKLCAGRTGQLLNLSNLANDCDVNHNTIKNWLSILEASYIIKLIQPYSKNITKRLVKMPKLYFLDTGLAAFLIGIRESEQLTTHPLKGALLETLVVSEIIKSICHSGTHQEVYFYRDHHGNEIDIVLENGMTQSLIEIKSSQTIQPEFFKAIAAFPQTEGVTLQKFIVYGGATQYERNGTTIVPWASAGSILSQTRSSHAEHRHPT